ncbi:aldehyde dehydrogenase family protein [Streptomyces sp. NBC_00083]|uniref:aldehyde dehydrogenase family protein n=1 Tax=Streptomyces sp. NBC_00083 TaxID=2975647 RepID=UPI0022518055|nr:aldehyde dehydrogenase family protein [Streptomyces sp. NBC_00083]MCX5386949.1 hypothetical protein [Streptomyces sp. NBC_00083]
MEPATGQSLGVVNLAADKDVAVAAVCAAAAQTAWARTPHIARAAVLRWAGAVRTA